MKKVIKRIYNILLIILVVFAYIVAPMPVKAVTLSDPKTLGDLKKNLETLKKEKANNEAQEAATKAEISAKQAAIEEAEEDIDEAEEEINAATEKIEESNLKIADLKEATEVALVSLQQMESKNAYLQYIADSASITELIMRISAMEQITDKYQQNLDELEALIKENEQLKIDLKNKQTELSNKITSYQAKVAALYDNLEDYDKFALDIDTQIKVVEANYNSYKKMCDAKGLGEDALLTDCSNTPYNAGWLKPLTKGRVTSPWGLRTDPITGVKYSSHSGIDIGGNAEGTPVYAAAGGTVAGIVSKYSCGGNMLYINVTVGGKQYTTYYYHLLRFNVSVGDTVTQDTIIGWVGGYSTSKSHGGYDGCTTGAHLHFGVMTGFYTGGTPASRQIKPPGFNNVVGYSFSSRTDYYGD